MKHIQTKTIVIILMIACMPPITAQTSVSPYFSMRSQSVYQSRIMAGWANHTYSSNNDMLYGNFAITPGYAQTFNDTSITRCLFGNTLQNCNGCQQITISGRDVSDRGSCDWLADYFGLPTDYKSVVRFQPRVKNFFVDMAFHLDLNGWAEGLWIRVWTPFVHTNWDLNACESICDKGSAVHPRGYFSSTTDNNEGTPRADLLNNAMEFFQGGKAPAIQNQGNTPSLIFETLESCRWGESTCPSSLTKNGLADLRLGIGWNMFRGDTYHFGLGFLAAAPTGTRPEGTFLFEPILGNGNHWEVGLMTTFHTVCWQSEDETRHVGVYLDANITHLFQTRQKRCFDLCGKLLSRYMLAERMTSSVSQLFAGESEGNLTPTPAKPSHQFSNRFAPVANLTCSSVNVSVGAQIDLVAMLNYTNGGVSCDIGYNLWSRSCEKIEFDCDGSPRLAKSTELWALKGDAHVYAWGASNASDASLQNLAVALSATQSEATLFKGTNKAQGSTDNLDKRNFGVDNDQFAYLALSAATTVANVNDQLKFENGITAATANTQSKTSKDPVLLTRSNINLQGARTKGLTHSVFAYMSYTWNNDMDWVPFIGCGMQAEFANNSNLCKECCPQSTSTSDCTTCTNCCDKCRRCAASQWQFFVKGGLSFN